MTSDGNIKKFFFFIVIDSEKNITSFVDRLLERVIDRLLIALVDLRKYNHVKSISSKSSKNIYIFENSKKQIKMKNENRNVKLSKI